jgi:hypothetical protein
VATLVRKGLLAPDDLDITRLTTAEALESRAPTVSPLAARLPDLGEGDEALSAPPVRLIPRK